MSLLREMKIIDGTGEVWTLSDNSAMPVSGDRNTEVVDIYFCQSINAVTLATDVTIDTYAVTLVAGHGVVVGNILCFKEGSHFLQAEVITVVVNAITIDRPLDFAFTTAANIERTTHNMNVDGSVTPQIFRISPANLTINFKITKIIFNIKDNTAMDTSMFGGLATLTNGIVVRKKDGTYKNYFNVKDNGDFLHHCTIVEFIDKAPAGTYGFRAIKKFAGFDNHGVVVELANSTTDELQIIIQDDLTGLTGFECVALGRVYL